MIADSATIQTLIGALATIAVGGLAAFSTYMIAKLKSVESQIGAAGLQAITNGERSARIEEKVKEIHVLADGNLSAMSNDLRILREALVASRQETAISRQETAIANLSEPIHHLTSGEIKLTPSDGVAIIGDIQEIKPL